MKECQLQGGTALQKVVSFLDILSWTAFKRTVKFSSDILIKFLNLPFSFLINMLLYKKVLFTTNTFACAVFYSSWTNCSKQWYNVCALKCIYWIPSEYYLCVFSNAPAWKKRKQNMDRRTCRENCCSVVANLTTMFVSKSMFRHLFVELFEFREKGQVLMLETGTNVFPILAVVHCLSSTKWRSKVS